MLGFERWEKAVYNLNIEYLRLRKEKNNMEPKERAAGKILVSTILLSKPRIILSVAFTGFTGMVLAYRGVPPSDLILFCVSSLLFSAAGAAILNNLLDKQVDVLMERLTKRVEALKVVGERLALIISLSLIAVSLFISFYFINPLNGVLIISAILSYTFLYTLYLKRSSPYGTILGGLPGALPVLIGYSAINPRIGVGGIILFLFMILWQPPHFWALAQKYKEDYKRAGVPVMPVALGTKYTNIFILLYSLSLFPLSLSLWFFGYCSEYYATVAIIFGLYFEYIMIQSALKNSNYGKAFGTSILYMLVIMASLVIDISLNSPRL
jgi:protoheme IX farnesyltransferase